MAIVTSTYSDNSVISQLTLEKSLEGHTGCVNTLE